MATMFKISGLLILFLICVFMGFLKAYMLKIRVTDLEEIHKGLSEILQRLRYEGTHRNRLVNDSFSHTNILKIQEDKPVFCDSALEEEDKKIFMEFYESLGTGDFGAESDRVRLYMSLFEGRLKEANKKYGELGRLYKTIGVCIGAAGFILLF